MGARPEVTYDSKQQKICLASSRALAFDVAMEPQITNTVPDLPQAFDKLAAGDVTGAVVAVVAATEPGVALDGLGQLCMQAYRELKNIPVMNAIAWEAIKFGLTCAETSGDAESARHYKSRVRTVAYNAGANCWPGWGDPVQITTADIAEGLKFADLNSEFVKELGLGGKEIGGALWLAGALRMANNQTSEALAEFVAAQKTFQDAGLAVHAEMARGYEAICKKALLGFRSEDALTLAAILESLRAIESREAQFFAEQLVTADRIFSSH